MYSKNLNENLLSGMNQSCSKSFKRSLLWHILLMIWCHQKKNLISQEKKSTWVDLFCEETWLPPSWRNMAHKKKWPLPTPLFIFCFTTCSVSFYYMFIICTFTSWGFALAWLYFSLSSPPTFYYSLLNTFCLIFFLTAADNDKKYSKLAIS